MKIVQFAGLMMLGAGLAVGHCLGEGSPDVRAQLKSFVTAKEQQARSLALSANAELSPQFQSFFSAIQSDNWEVASNNYFEIRSLINDRAFHRSWWQPVLETYGAEDQLINGNEKYFTAYGNDIIQSIPPGSIYFGGTDPARFIVTAMQKSQIEGNPFFTLTQNALADSVYLDYLRSMYGNQIYIPTQKDSEKCFNDYYADVERRMQSHQLEPGESVSTDPVTGRMKVAGQIAVMQINGRLVKVIFDKEPNRQFYVEESYPLDWMYPYLEPHGLIFRLNHEPLAGLTDEIVRRDHAYWTKTVSPMIGNWLDTNTSVKDISVFAEKVFHRHDFSGFNGDTNFVLNALSHRMFSKLRSSNAGLYAWRAQHNVDITEKQHMHDEADFAFRQSWALCPDSPEAVFRYVQFLMQTNRVDDALIVARTDLALDPYNSAVSSLIRNLEQYEQSATLSQSPGQLRSLEDETPANPADYKKIFSLAAYYLEKQETNRASELLLQTASQPGASIDALRGIAQFFAQISDFAHLQTVLQKITVTQPGVPEPWYDLARVDAHLGKDDEAIQCLQTAIDLSDQRRQTNAMALDIRSAARAAKDFESIQDRPEFQKLVQP